MDRRTALESVLGRRMIVSIVVIGSIGTVACNDATGRSASTNNQPSAVTPVSGAPVSASPSQSSSPTTIPAPTTTTAGTTPGTGTTVPWASAVADEVAAQAIPMTIAIPAIQVEAPIIGVGIASDSGQMEVVDDPSTVGWYQWGPSPGDAGSSVLAAHVDLAGYGPGVFFDLDQLTEGDEVSIGFDDGTTDTFVVVDGRRVDKTELAIDEIFRRDGPPVVRLVTCGGAFNRTERRYADNVVVTLSPVEVREG